MDYNTLVDQIKQYAKRTDDYFFNEIPYIIDFAINGIYLGARNIGFEIRVNGNFVANAQTLNKPNNWKQTISFGINDTSTIPTTYEFLISRSTEFCQIYNNTNITGVPKFYADIGYTDFYFSPIPDHAYAFQLTYLGLPLFNQDNPTNFLTERYEPLLLSACLYHTAIFVKNDEKIPGYESIYKNQLALANDSAKDIYTDRTSRRDKT